MRYRWLVSALSLVILPGCTGAISDPGGEGSDPGNGAANGGSTSNGSGGSGAGSGAGTSGGGTGGSTIETLGIALDGHPLRSRFVRLTHEQWEHSVRDLLRLGAAPGLSSSFTGDPPEGHFGNNERALYVTQTLWSDYQRAAETLSEQVARDSAALSGLTGGSTDPVAFIRSFGRRAYRRPLTQAEEQRYQTIFAAGAEVFESGDGFADGAQLVIEAVLQSPHFVYRTELGTDGAPLTGFELASKLSFLLRETIPDDALLDAAERGELDSVEGLVATARSMLDEVAAEGALLQFHAELLGFDRYPNIEKNRTLFPAFDETLPPQMRAADDVFVTELYRREEGFRALLTSTRGYVNEATAPLYGLSASGDAFSEVDLGASRPGLFTRLGFLALNATLRDPDPIHRGVDLNHRILCAPLSPPPGIIPALPEFMPGQTNRERVDAHTGPGTCGASCHGGIINPVGFAFENFDALGVQRTMDNGKPVDTTGEYAFVDGYKPFADAPELLNLIADSQQAHACYAAHLAEYTLARDVEPADVEFVRRLTEASRTTNASIKDIVVSIVEDPAFRVRGGGAL